jgi:aspartyl protease family protein
MFRVALTFAALCCGLACVNENDIHSVLRLFGVAGPTAQSQVQAPAPRTIQVAVADPAPQSAPAAGGLQVLRPLADNRMPEVSGYREASIEADRAGQYQADFLINGVDVHGLIDTGATFVSLTPSTADRLGLSVNRSGPHYQMRTANGLANAWPVTLNTISFQGLYVQDVQAIVGEDEVGGNLFGESFLKRLQSVQQQGGNLVLKQ